jgi:hypothetical protein
VPCAGSAARSGVVVQTASRSSRRSRSRAPPKQARTTDAQGQFALDLPEGAFSVEIQSPGHVTQKRNVTINSMAWTVLNVDLRSGK